MANGLEGLRNIGAHIAQRLTDAGFSGIDNSNRWKSNKLALEGQKLGLDEQRFQNSIAPALFNLKHQGVQIEDKNASTNRLNAETRGGELIHQGKELALNERKQTHGENTYLTDLAKALAVNAGAPEALTQKGVVNPFTGATNWNAFTGYIGLGKDLAAKQEGVVSGKRTSAQEAVKERYEEERRRRDEAGTVIDSGEVADPNQARATVDKQFPKGTTPPKRGAGVQTEAAKLARMRLGEINKTINRAAEDMVGAQVEMEQTYGKKSDGSRYTIQDMVSKRDELSRMAIGMVSPQPQQQETNDQWKRIGPDEKVSSLKTGNLRNDYKVRMSSIMQMKGYTSPDQLTPADENTLHTVLKMMGYSNEDIEGLFNE